MRKIISITSVSLLLLFVPCAVPQATKTPVRPRGPSVAAGSQGVVVSGRPAATAAGIPFTIANQSWSDAAGSQDGEIHPEKISAARSPDLPAVEHRQSVDAACRNCDQKLANTRGIRAL